MKDCHFTAEGGIERIGMISTDLVKSAASRARRLTKELETECLVNDRWNVPDT